MLSHSHFYLSRFNSQKAAEVFSIYLSGNGYKTVSNALRLQLEQKENKAMSHIYQNSILTIPESFGKTFF